VPAPSRDRGPPVDSRPGGTARTERSVPATTAPLARILVAFDGSPHALRASELALEIVERFRSRITIAVVHADGDATADSRLAALVPVTEDGRSLGSLVEEFGERAKARGAVGVEVAYLRGDVEPALLEYLAEHPQDLAVVGSRGLSRGRRLLLGSVSAGLVNEAPCPVLVVRAPHPQRASANTNGVRS
jgi:nucleotide-binding universal stress UspA family protein